MKTAEAIAGITDAGEFEVLALRVLREIDPDCRFIEHLGVNPAGKTRKNPVDGFVEVPGSSPRTFVIAQFATTATDTLEAKWLFDHEQANADAVKNGKKPKLTEADDGDLLKAARIADGTRQSAPDAVFKLWLCSNQVLDSDLRTKVSTEAIKRGLTVQFLSQTVLRDFLDTKPEGHWIRKIHLGVAATLLSQEQLRTIGLETTKMYGAEIAATYQTVFVPTENSEALGQFISQQGKGLVFVVGPSGGGKSVLAFQRLQAYLESGGVGMRIPERLVEQSDSLAEAIEKTLLKGAPDLEPGCGRVAIELSHPKEFIVAVDDINRAADPRRLVEKLAAWTKPPAEQSGSNRKSGSQTVTIVCPLWESFWNLVHRGLKGSDWVGGFETQRLPRRDSVALLRATLGTVGNNLPDPQLEEISEHLASDPILLAIFAANAVERGTISGRATAARTVIAEYEDACFGALAANGRGTKSEFLSAVARVAIFMLHERNFYPTWDTLTANLAKESHLLDALRILVSDRRICRLVDRNGAERFEFRHDRILEFVLVRLLAAELKKSGSSEYLHEPYYARYVGEALAIAQLPPAVVDSICEVMPSVIFSALAAAESGADNEANFSKRAQAWLSRSDGFAAAMDALKEQVVGFLEETNSRSVVDVVPAVAPLRIFSRALLRNGDFRAALYSVSEHSSTFLPSMQYDLLESDIEHVFAWHGAELLEKLTYLLERGTDPAEVSSALTLAGYLARPQLEAGVIRAVGQHFSDDLLLPSLWGVMRCGATRCHETLKVLIGRWAQLPDPGPLGHTITERQMMTQSVRFFIRKGLSDGMVNLLVEHGRSNSAAGQVLASALSEVDHPSAVEFAVEQRIVSDEWNLVMPRARQLSSRSRAALRQMWENDTRDVEVRQKAFRVWLNSSKDAQELSGLKILDSWRDSLLWRRCVIRDVSAANELAPRFAQDPFWIHVAHHVWAPILVEPVDKLMGVVANDIVLNTSSDSDDRQYHLADLLRDIPKADAEPLLLKHWAGLSSSPRFIQAALYIGTPQLLSLADAAIQARTNKTDVFTHVGSFFGFMMHGLSERIDSRHIRVLVDYRRILPDSELGFITRHCSEAGNLREWVPLLREEIYKRAEHAPPESPAAENRRRSFPTEAELFREFDRASTWQFPGWLERLEARAESKEALWSALLRWASQDLSNRYMAFAGAFAMCATRSELHWLLQVPVEQLNDAQRRARDDAVFSVRMRSLV